MRGSGSAPTGWRCGRWRRNSGPDPGRWPCGRPAPVPPFHRFRRGSAPSRPRAPGSGGVRGRSPLGNGERAGPGHGPPQAHPTPPYATPHEIGACHRMQHPVGPPLPPAHPPIPALPPADATTAAVAVLLIGPAGAGKTTVARYWADTRRVPTAHISLDDVREWVRSGFADPQSGWNDHSEAQYRLARRTCGFAARNFLANGISCILDDAVFPDRPVVGLGGWKRHVGPGLLPVVLLPGLDVVLERNAERTGNRRLSDEEVARIHGRMAGWYGSGLPIIDNSQQDVATTARLIDEAVARTLAGW
ncbi:AAA family ATPase [Streptomyces abikoensis]|uniref:AAA family ATPase n=1 Tax=Streptomyces abikoensis TaxID=97398 RepID=UPI001E2DF3AD|nr:AAA family ATPase [Streptomyces abikoensis]